MAVGRRRLAAEQGPIVPAGCESAARRSEEAGQTATFAGIEASDITLLADDLSTVPRALRLSRRTIYQNLGWAFGYNAAALPLAAFGLLNPVIAGAALSISSVSVVANSVRLRRLR